MKFDATLVCPQNTTEDTLSLLSAVYGYNMNGIGVFTRAGVLIYANAAWQLHAGTGTDSVTFTALTVGCESLFASFVNGSRQEWSGSLPLHLPSGRRVFSASLRSLEPGFFPEKFIVAEITPQHSESSAHACCTCPSWHLPARLHSVRESVEHRLTVLFSVLQKRTGCTSASLWLAGGEKGAPVTVDHPMPVNGVPASRLFGQKFADYVVGKKDTVALDSEGLTRLTSQGILPEGMTLPDSILAAPLFTSDGDVLGVLTVCRSGAGARFGMTEAIFLRNVGSVLAAVERIHANERALRESEARFRAVFDNAGLGIALLSPQGRVKQINQVIKSMSSLPESTLLGRHYSEFLSAADARVADGFFKAIHHGSEEVLHMTCAVQRMYASLVWCKLTMSSVRDNESELQNIIVQVEDVTEHKREDERITFMAYHDVLTGLPNRALFQDRLQGAFNRAQRNSDFTFAVLYMDMDGFKTVNDAMGHDVGDMLLGMFAERVKNCLRNVDTLARLGGDEFAVLLDDVPEILQVTHIIERITEAVSKPFVLDGREIKCGVSIGAVLKGQEYSCSEDLLREADSAMYKAKRTGTNRYAIAGTSDEAKALRMQRGEEELLAALKFEQMELFFQPVVSLRTGRMHAAEALLRWRHPRKGLLLPGAFLPLVESAGLQFELDAHVLSLVAKSLDTLVAREKEFGLQRIALHANILSTTLRRPDVVDDLLTPLRSGGVDLSRLCFEIRECLLVNSAASVAESLWQLRDAGIQIALDGFGTGYSSLAMLRRFPLSLIKVDGTFVRTSDKDNAARGIVRSSMSLAEGFGLTAIAEGVEMPEHAELLRDMGFAMAQGTYFASPMPLQRLLRMYERQESFPVVAG
ncbi:putative bifunctional diguanylate cyclase/phosphodiesterase [Oleidesulfovibrio sp.]|uniref:putative bifunctional diguanylate cyclase/phosphodiesterase n=1 Tax=Oleidesulfovibrio sp. TaxID=2909707 RepID=UPI003A894582